MFTNTESAITFPREFFDKIIRELGIEEGLIGEYNEIKTINVQWDNNYELVTFQFKVLGRLDS